MTRDEVTALLRADVVNEQTHMLFYLMNAASVQGLHRAQLQPLLASEAESEMGHVREFTAQLVALAGPSALAGLAPSVVLVSSDPIAILDEAIRLEAEVVKNYDLRISQFEDLRDAETDPQLRAFWKSLVVFYEDQLEHSHTDLNNFQQIVAGY